MATLSMVEGDWGMQLVELKYNARINMAIVLTADEMDGETLPYGSYGGRGLTEFRLCLNADFAAIEAATTEDQNFQVFQSGDTIFDVRSKLATNFGICSDLVITP